jgi:MFS family permease
MLVRSGMLMHPFRNVPSGTRRVVLAATPLALALGFYNVAVAVFLPLEGMPVTNLGAILTTFGVTMVTFSIPFAILSDRHGRKCIMVAGALIASWVLAVPGLTSDFLLLEVSAVVGGMGEAMYLSTWNAYLADTTSEEVRPAVFSLSFVTFTIASGLGSFLPALFPLFPLSLREAHRLTFIGLGLVSLLTPLAVFQYATDVRPTQSRRGILPRKSLGIIAKFSVSNMLIALGAGLIIPLVPTWFLVRFNETDVFSGPLIAASSIAMGVAAVASPWIARRVGLVKGIVMTQLLSTVFLFSMPFSSTPAIAGSLYVVRSMLMNMSSPLGDTFLMNKIAEDERATASSFNVVIWRLPNAASTVVGGSLLSSGNLSLPFYLCSILYVISISIFYTLFRKAEQTAIPEDHL